MSSSSTPAPPTPARFVRDRVTIACYGPGIVWGWVGYVISPAVTLLAVELGVSRAVAGLHGTMMCVGQIGAAMAGPRLIRRFGRRFAIIGTQLASCVALSGLLLGHHLAITLTSTLLAGFMFATGCVAGGATLATHHREAASAAFTESSGASSMAGLLAPLAVGATTALAWGWRSALIVALPLALVFAGLAARVRGVPAFDGRSRPPTPTARKRPLARTATRAVPDFLRRVRSARAFALFVLSATMGSMLEGAVAYWSAQLIISQTGAPPALAASAISCLVIGIVLSRLTVGPMSLRREAVSLLLVALIVCAVGWLLLWLSTTVVLAMAGLVLIGLGIGPVNPLSTAMAMRVTGNTYDVAQSRIQFICGIGAASAPFGLGALTDLVGAHLAFVAVPCLMAVAAVASLTGRATVRGAQLWRIGLASRDRWWRRLGWLWRAGRRR